MRLRRFLIARALVREALPTLLLATGATTFLVLINALFKLAELFISRSVGFLDGLRLVVLFLPNTMALTLPIGTLFAVLMTSARWSADSECIAVQACGLPLRRLARPLVGVGVLAFLVNAVNCWFWMPAANLELREITRRVGFSAASTAVESRVFVEEFPGKLVYVDRVDRTTNRWRGILLFDQSTPGVERLITARTGTLLADQEAGTAWLQLQETATHEVRPEQPGAYRRMSNREQTILLTPVPDESSLQRVSYGERETPSATLRARLAEDGLSSQDVRNATIELHKRLAIPAAAIAFVLIAFPLGVRNRRGGKGFGLTASVALVVSYYVLYINGESLASAGTLPVGLAMWLPDIAIGAVGVYLFWRLAKAPSPATSSFLSRELAPLLAGLAGRFRRRSSNGQGTLTRPLDRRAVRRANGGQAWQLGIIDRYLLRQCLAFFTLVLVLICSLALVIRFSEKLDAIRQNQVPLGTVLSYFVFGLPQILHDVFPLAFLIAFLSATTVLERHNETTALKASGVSLSRVALPLIMLALALGACLFLVDDSLVQRANRAAQRLDDIIRGRKISRSYRATDRSSMFLPDGRTLVNFLEFDPDTATLARPSVYVFDDDMNLRVRYLAARARFVDGKWKAEGAWSRSFLADGSERFSQHAVPIDLPLPVGQDYFGREYRKPDQMSFGELRGYIGALRAAGYRVDRLRVQLHQKLAYPLSLAVLTWLAVPFGFRSGRRGTVMGIAVALVLGMAYFGLLAFSTRLGEASMIEPLLAAWTPAVVFSLVAAHRHTSLRT